MSARVFNPVAMELRRAMRGGAANAAAAAAAEAAAAPATAEPCSQALARVRRNLFGPVDHEETRRFVEQELALMSRRDEDLYEFDFVRERPRDGPARRFLWERVRPGAVPVSYALRRLDFLGTTTAAAATAATAAAAPTDALGAAAVPPSSAAPAPGPVPETTIAQPAATQPPCTPATTRTRQSHIDDFMRTRKRPHADGADGGGGGGKAATGDGPAAPKQQRKTASASSASATATAAASRS